MYGQGANITILYGSYNPNKCVLRMLVSLILRLSFFSPSPCIDGGGHLSADMRNLCV